jgi:enoyl-CoA hydratase/carnithine racemase
MSIQASDPIKKVRLLTIDRPPVNALNGEMVDELTEAVLSAMGDPRVKAMVITGSGKVFVAGADLDRLGDADETAARLMVTGVKRLHRELRKGPKPVIAAMNGAALGGGLELAMACDIRIADKKAGMGLPEVTLGVLPGAGGTQMLPRLIGLGKALELMLSGKIISADEALALGLIEHVAKEGTAVDYALDLAQAIALNAPLALAETKAAAYDALSLPLDNGLEEETERFARLCGTEDKKEGIAAFKSGRAAVFRGF